MSKVFGRKLLKLGKLPRNIDLEKATVILRLTVFLQLNYLIPVSFWLAVRAALKMPTKLDWKICPENGDPEEVWL